MKDETNKDSKPKIAVGYFTSKAAPNVIWTNNLKSVYLSR